MTLLPKVHLKALVQFPATVFGGTAISVVKQNPNYTINIDYSEFLPAVTALPADATVLFYSPIANNYVLGPLALAAGTPEAPNNGIQYGRQSLGWTPIAVAPSPATVVPLVESGSGTVGTAVKYAREDHVHPASSGGITQNSQSANYTTVLTDAQKHLFHPSADTTARTFTIAANASVAYPIGTAITFVNQNAAGVITIAITSDTLRLASTGTTGNRTLAANGVCTALKVTATEWIISGKGLT